MERGQQGPATPPSTQCTLDPPRPELQIATKPPFHGIGCVTSLSTPSSVQALHGLPGIMPPSYARHTLMSAAWASSEHVSSGKAALQHDACLAC